MSSLITITGTLHFKKGRSGQKFIAAEPPAEPVATPGRVPRVSRLMALAIRFDRLIREGAIADQAELARLGHVTRARATQIMNLLQLAPDIQEELLFLPPVAAGRDLIRERDIRPIAAVFDWRKQRRLWRELTADAMDRRKTDEL